MAAKKQSKASKSSVKAGGSTHHPLGIDCGDDLITTELKVGKGEKREYIVTVPSKEIQEVRTQRTTSEKVLLSILLVTSLFLRFYKLSQPSSVVFDEVHFGGFARKYILGTYFMDVHPPLAKMMFAGCGFLFGYNGQFEFAKIGDDFPESVPYTMMRALSALCGVGIIFALYSTLRLSGCKPIICFFTSALLLIENAQFTISRYILLDAPLIFFISCAVYSLKRSQLNTPFSFSWYKSLAATGVSLGLAASSKWVGLFTVAWVGLVTVWDLWFVLGDISVKPSNLIRQIGAKLTFFLGIPIVLYLYFFSIHYQLLNKEGDGAPFMSAPFRSTLIGNQLPKNITADVGVGSKVTIRHVNTQGGYLHSHNHLLETGSKQQQITLYPHLDDNNIFEIELYNETEYPTEFVPILHGTKIRLMHQQTKRRLHSHDIKAPVSENADWQKEVSAYGYDGFEGDPNDDFIVEIVSQKSKKGPAQSRVRALETIFRLHHAMTGCYLFSHEVKMPEWAFEQQEVTCATQGIESLSYWYVETNENEFLPEDAERVDYEAPSFLSKVLESHAKMWKINAGLTESHNWESSPDSWPFLLRGINYWVKDNTQVYLFGNIVTWYATTLSIFLFAAYVAVQILRWQRGYKVGGSPEVYNFNVQTFQFIAAWGIHYLPSFLMGRQLFLHHYLPAYYFGLLALGHTFEIVHSYILKNKRIVSYAILGAFFSSAFTAFYKYSPLIKGDRWTKSECENSKLISSWDFDCNAFLESPQAYESVSQQANAAVQTSSIDFAAAIPVNANDQAQAQEPFIAFEDQAIPESQDDVDFKSQVQIEETSGDSEQAQVKNDESTVGEPNAENALETPNDDEVHSYLHQEALKQVTTELSPEQLEPIQENVAIIRDGVYYDKDGNQLGDDAVKEAEDLKKNFPMDKLTIKQKRRAGDAIGTSV